MENAKQLKMTSIARVISASSSSGTEFVFHSIFGMLVMALLLMNVMQVCIANESVNVTEQQIAPLLEQAQALQQELSSNESTSDGNTEQETESESSESETHHQQPNPPVVIEYSASSLYASELKQQKIQPVSAFPLNYPEVKTHSQRSIDFFNPNLLKGVQSLIRRGRIEDAIQKLETVSASQQTWEHYFWLGTAFLLNHDLDRAKEALEKSLSMENHQVAVWIQRAIVEQERQDPISALQYLQIAQQLNQEIPEIYLNQAYAYEFLGNPSLARYNYGQYLRIATLNGQQKSLRNQIIKRMKHLSKSEREK